MPGNMLSGASVYVANKKANPNFKFKKPLVILPKAISHIQARIMDLNTSDLSGLDTVSSTGTPQKSEFTHGTSDLEEIDCDSVGFINQANTSELSEDDCIRPGSNVELFMCQI